MSYRVELLPAWPGIWHSWAKDYCRRNLWRLKTLIGEEEDLLAECALIYVETRKRYEHVTSTAAMMALFQVSVINWFNSYSRKDTILRHTVDLPDDDPLEAHCVVEEEATFAVKLREASAEVRCLLYVMAHAPVAGCSIGKIASYCQIPRYRVPSVVQELRGLLT